MEQRIRGAYHISEETKEKMSLSHKGRPNVGQYTEGQIPWITGKHHSEEARYKIREKRTLQIFPKKDDFLEVKIQNQLKNTGIVFTKHKLFKLSNGSYCRVDIFIEPNLCIEADGCYWHDCPEHFRYNGVHKGDRIRDLFQTDDLERMGYMVHRIWEHDIIKPDFDIRKYL